MSFSIVKAGKVDDVRAEVAAADIAHGGELAELTKKYLADVLALAHSRCVIAEALGHADDRAANVSVTVRPVF